MEQYGFFNTSGAGATTTKSEQAKSVAPKARRRNGTADGSPVKREYPPPLTTSLTRQTGGLMTVTKRFNLVKRRIDDENNSRRVVIEAEEIRDENQYYLKERRVNGRLIVSLIPMRELQTSSSCDTNDHDDGIMVSDHDENACMDGEVVVDFDQDESADKDHLKMSFPFFESIFDPVTVRSIM